MRRAALAAFAAGVVAFAALAAVPFVLEQREFAASITSPPARTAVALAVVPGGSRLCMTKIAAEPRSDVARFKVGTYGRPGQPLALDLTAPGYRAGGRVPRGYGDNRVLEVPVASPRREQLVRACIRNQGGRKVAFYAAEDRSQSRSEVTVDGKKIRSTPQFGFWQAGARSFADEASITARRVALFRGPLGQTWVVHTVLVLVAVALTAGLAAALWTGFTERR